MSRAFRVLVPLALLSVSLLRSGKADAATPANGADRAMVFSAAVEKVGAAVLLRVVLENRGAAPIWAFSLLDFEDQDCTQRARAAVQIKLTDGAGRTLPSTCQPLVPPYFRKSYRTFKPGERVTGTIALSSCYELDAAHRESGSKPPTPKISVSAFYQDPTESPEPPPAGVVPLRTRLSAPVVDAAAPSSPRGNDPRATLRLATVNDHGKVVLRTTVKNEGAAPLWINGLMSAGDETCKPQSRRSIRITVSDQNRRVLHDTCTANPVPPEARHYKVVAPGAEISSVSELDCYAFVHGETLRVDAHYWDPSDPVPKAPQGATHLSDRLNAKPLIFVVP
jgi:hypothetical protein